MSHDEEHRWMEEQQMEHAEKHWKNIDTRPQPLLLYPILVQNPRPHIPKALQASKAPGRGSTA